METSERPGTSRASLDRRAVEAVLTSTYASEDESIPCLLPTATGDGETWVVPSDRDVCASSDEEAVDQVLKDLDVILAGLDSRE